MLYTPLINSSPRLSCSSFSQSDFLLAVRALKFLLQPTMDAARMENVSALQSFDLNARPENFEAN